MLMDSRALSGDLHNINNYNYLMSHKRVVVLDHHELQRHVVKEVIPWLDKVCTDPAKALDDLLRRCDHDGLGLPILFLDAMLRLEPHHERCNQRADVNRLLLARRGVDPAKQRSSSVSPAS
jgi:hypothetical protein